MAAKTATNVSLVLASAAMLATLGFGAALGSEALATDLSAQSQEALLSLGFSEGYELEFTGREGFITVTCSGAEHRQAIAEAVAGINGVRWAEVTAAEVQPPNFEYRNTGEHITLSGTLCSQKEAVAAAAPFPGAVVDLFIDAQTVAASWIGELTAFLQHSGAGVSELSVTEGQITVTGVAANAHLRDFLVQSIAQLTQMPVTAHVELLPEVTWPSGAEIAASIIYFDADSSVIAEEYQSVLDSLAELMRAHPQARLNIFGHTAVLGSGETDPVGVARAEQVQQYLLQQGGVRPEQLQAAGKGATEPAVRSDVHELNRRVTFELITD